LLCLAVYCKEWFFWGACLDVCCKEWHVVLAVVPPNQEDPCVAAAAVAVP
jgi:hypothetical protein